MNCVSLVVPLVTHTHIKLPHLIDELCVFGGTASNTYTYQTTALDIIVKLHLENK